MNIIVASLIIALAMVGTGLIFLARAAGAFGVKLRAVNASIGALPLAKAKADGERLTLAMLKFADLRERAEHLFTPRPR